MLKGQKCHETVVGGVLGSSVRTTDVGKAQGSLSWAISPRDYPCFAKWRAHVVSCTGSRCSVTVQAALKVIIILGLGRLSLWAFFASPKIANHFWSHCESFFSRPKRWTKAEVTHGKRPILLTLYTPRASASKLVSI